VEAVEQVYTNFVVPETHRKMTALKRYRQGFEYLAIIKGLSIDKCIMEYTGQGKKARLDLASKF
jgi:hypothetical protein